MTDQGSDNISYVYLRLSPGVRHSRVNFEELEQVTDSASLLHDERDPSVYFFALPGDIAPGDANKIISALVVKPYIDEAWKSDKTGRQIKPLSLSPE